MLTTPANDQKNTFHLPENLVPHPLPRLLNAPTPGDIICALHKDGTYSLHYIDTEAPTSETLFEADDTESDQPVFLIAYSDVPWASSEYSGGEEVTLYRVEKSNLIYLLALFLEGKRLELLPSPIAYHQSQLL